ncbi:MAG TPA: BlaI/MecI/CopY family transcriptional regulator [Candidatus Acidoferrales bacterium]|nr:BlaI/MecI/CopY family transcriptional regulator [Candidatus Acidoferrales bacterium]
MRTAALNQNELEALRILWENGVAKPAEIQSHFSWPVENATLRSVLLNLVQKGHVKRTLRGKTFFYEARVKKSALLQNMLHSMARIFAAGSKQELVAQLVKTGDIKPEDLEVIRRTITEGKSDLIKKQSP